MTQEDPSDLYLKSIQLIAETDHRLYLYDQNNKILVTSWKPVDKGQIDMASFQTNALKLVEYLALYQPEYVIVDCSKMGFEMSEEDNRWYVQQTKHIWAKAKPKKIAFIFKENLSAQLGMEGLRDIAIEEGVIILNYRIFESNIEAVNWLIN